jgi:hypothetical protein
VFLLLDFYLFPVGQPFGESDVIVQITKAICSADSPTEPSMGLLSEWTQPQMGLNPEWTQNRKGLNLEWTQPQLGLNLEWTLHQMGLNTEWGST